MRIFRYDCSAGDVWSSHRIMLVPEYLSISTLAMVASGKSFFYSVFSTFKFLVVIHSQ